MDKFELAKAVEELIQKEAGNLREEEIREALAMLIGLHPDFRI